jgi:hypothetical protein
VFPKRVAVGLIAALAIALSARAYADPKDPRYEEAKTHFEKGVRLLDSKDFLRAAQEFRASVELWESLPAWYNLALALRGERSFRGAKKALDRFLALAEKTNASADSVDKARALLGEIEPKISKLTVKVSGKASEVKVDGEKIGDGDGTYEMTVDPGKHEVIASRSGFAPVRDVREIAEGERAIVEVDAALVPNPGKLIVQATPIDAEIRIDGAVVGRGEVMRELPVGEHKIEVVAEDHLGEVRAVVVPPGAETRVQISLPEESESVAGEWWFWAGIGAVVLAGAAVTAIALYPRCDGGSTGICITVQD